MNDMTLNNRSIIEENIMKSRVKEIKTTKNVLEQKLYCLESQIKLLMNEEEQLKDKKKQNIKNYLDNFEKDKKESELKSKEFEKKREERMQYLREVQLKAELKVKEKFEKIEEERTNKETKRREDYEQNLVRMRQKSIDFLEEKIKQREEWKLNKRSIDGKEYLHNRYEEMFNKKEEAFQSDLQQKQEEERLKRKLLLKPIRHEVFDEFQHLYEEEKKRRILEKEKDRIIELEVVKSHALNDFKSNSLFYYRVLEEEKAAKELSEKKYMEKNYTSMRRGNFSKIVRENIPPKVNLEKKKEIEDRVYKIKHSKIIKKHIYDRSKIVLLKKHDPNKPKKFNWKLNLSIDESLEKDLKKQKRAKSHYGSFNNSLNKSKDVSDRPLSVGNVGSSIGYNSSKNFTVDKRVPLTKNPDYLTESRVKKSHNIMCHSEKSKLILFSLYPLLYLNILISFI